MNIGDRPHSDTWWFRIALQLVQRRDRAPAGSIVERREHLSFGWRFASPILLGGMLNPLNSSMIATALVPIATTYRVDAVATSAIVASSYLASAIGQPVLGRVVDAVGGRRVYLSGLVVLAIGGLGGVLVSSVNQLIIVRVLIGLSASASYPAAMAMIKNESTRSGRPVPGRILGAVSLGSVVGLAIGPALGGGLGWLINWRAVFAVNLPLALVGVVLTLRWLPADRPGNRSAGWRSLDVLGMIGFVAIVALLALFLGDLQHPSWWLLFAAAALAVAAARWERRAPMPFIDIAAFRRSGPLLVTYLRHGLTFVALYGALFAYPQWLEQARGMGPGEAGLLATPLPVVAVLCTVLGSRSRWTRGPILVGTVALISASVALTQVSAGYSLVGLLVVAGMFGLPFGLNAAGNQAAMYEQAPTGLAGTAAGLLRSAQYLGAIVASSMIGSAYGLRATDQGLHSLAVEFVGIGLVLGAGVVADQAITRHWWVKVADGDGRRAMRSVAVSRARRRMVFATAGGYGLLASRALAAGFHRGIAIYPAVLLAAGAVIGLAVHYSGPGPSLGVAVQSARTHEIAHNGYRMGRFEATPLTPATVAQGARTPPMDLGGPVRYLVEPGDSLSKIALRYGVPLELIAASSNVPNPNEIVAGKILTIPRQVGEVEIVRPGTSLSYYVIKDRCSLADLLARNPRITNRDYIEAGTGLRI